METHLLEPRIPGHPFPGLAPLTALDSIQGASSPLPKHPYGLRAEAWQQLARSLLQFQQQGWRLRWPGDWELRR